MKYMMKLGIFILMNIAWSLSASEQQDKQQPEALIPAPAGYVSPAEAIMKLQQLGKSDAVKIIKVATTPEGREILSMVFGEEDTTGRPAVIIVADPAGDRPVATQVALALCEHLARRESPLLEVATVYIVPLANPDAAEHAFAGEEPRRGEPVDEDRDGLMDEDPSEDLNGDGLVLQMRVPDPTGEWHKDENDPRYMRKAKRDEGEAGGWRLLQEGIDNDSDKQINEDPYGGVHLEANWPHRWSQYDVHSGRFQLSELETHGLASFMLDRPNIVLVIVFGAEDNMSQPPKGIDRVEPQSTDPLNQDAVLTKLLGERLLKDMKNKPRSAEHGSGNFADWVYYHFGALVLESAVWSPPLDADENKEEDKTPEGIKLLRWNDRILGGRGFMPWIPFKHPELGEVEIGGWKPFVLNNPPASELDALFRRWTAFLDSLAQDFAKLSWEKMEVKELGNGVFDARITLVNEGGPTSSQISGIVRRVLPLRVYLELPEGGQLLIGKNIQLVQRLVGWGDYREFRWVYRLPAGSKPARVCVVSQTAGEATAVLGL